ncbi:hypothetical protein BGZ75_008564, partial [Mortierella antarctica]
MRDPSLETIIKEAAIARFSQTPTPSKIKSLHLPALPERDENPMALPLLKSGLLDLESCTVFSFTESLESGAIEEIVREYCPNLKHLRCPPSYDPCDGVNAHTFIRGCLCLQGFTSSNFRERRYDADNDSFESQYIISSLVSHHCDSLEDFELEHCIHVYSSDLQAILSRCKHLKRFYVTVHHLDGDAGLDFEDVLNGNWVCSELKELRIATGRYSSMYMYAMTRFFQHIGRLKKLEHLAFDVNRRRPRRAVNSD